MNRLRLWGGGDMRDVSLVHNNHELHITASRVKTTRVEKTEYGVREGPRGYHCGAISSLGKMGSI